MLGNWCQIRQSKVWWRICVQRILATKLLSTVISFNVCLEKPEKADEELSDTEIPTPQGNKEHCFSYSFVYIHFSCSLQHIFIKSLLNFFHLKSRIVSATYSAWRFHHPVRFVFTGQYFGASQFEHEKSSVSFLRRPFETEKHDFILKTIWKS